MGIRKLLIIASTLFYSLGFALTATAAVKVPRVCETQSVDCFVLNLGNDVYAFHWKGNRLYYKRKNASSLKINGRTVNSSDSPVQSTALNWRLDNGIFSLSSDKINLKIDFKRDRLLKVNGKTLGNLNYDFQKIGDAAKSELAKQAKRKAQQKAKQAKRQAQQKRDNLLKSSFGRLDDIQKKQIQVILGNAGHYKSNVDGLWGNGTLLAVKAFIRNYATVMGSTLSEPVNPNDADRLFQLILNFEAERAKRVEAKKQREAEEKRRAEEREAEEKRRAEAERKKREEAALEKARIAEEKRKPREANIKLAQEDLDKKIAIAQEKIKSDVSSNYGFRNLIPGMTKEDVIKECTHDLTATNWPWCYGIENIKFKGVYFPRLIRSANYGGQEKRKSFDILTLLILDLGPITNSWSLSSNDPNDGDILNTTRRALSKYDLEYEYSQRDLELYNEGEKNKLIVVYEGGKVALVIQKIKKDYSSENRLFIHYKDAESGKKYLEQNAPKRASSSDF